MTLIANFTSKSVFDQQGCRALTFALARLSCEVGLQRMRNLRLQRLRRSLVSIRAGCH